MDDRRIRRDAAAIGPGTAALTAFILENRPHPEQGCRACIGILRLARQYGAERLEAACDRGLDIGVRSYGSIQSILKRGLDRRPPRPAAQGELLPDHPNISRPPLLPLTSTVRRLTLLTHPTILDRIIHNAHRLQLSGDSLRKQNGPKTTDA